MIPKTLFRFDKLYQRIPHEKKYVEGEIGIRLGGSWHNFD